MSPLEYYEGVAQILSAYISDTPTATTFNSQNESNLGGPSKIYTSEEIYAMMFMNGVPLEYEHRNLNKLLVVLRVISVYSSPKEKMPQREVIKQNTDLNEQRKKMYNTRG